MTSRSLTIAILAGALGASAGCSVCDNVWRTVYHEPHDFYWKRDRLESRELYLSWASEALAETLAAGCDKHSADYAFGFQEGFAEYVYAGGTGQPPPVPPRPYWNALNRTAEGQAAVDQWFDGYRHGAQVAREGGYREQAIVRSSLGNSAVGQVLYESYNDSSYPAGGEEVYVPTEDSVDAIELVPPLEAPGGPTLPEPTPPEPTTVPPPADDYSVGAEASVNETTARIDVVQATHTRGHPPRPRHGSLFSTQRVETADGHEADERSRGVSNEFQSLIRP